MKKAITLAATLLVSTHAFADTEVHSSNYTYSIAANGDNYPRLTIPGFDDMGGQRMLTRVDVRVQADISATVAIENMTGAPLNEWTLEGQHLVLTGFEREDPKTFGPFAFLGGLFIEPFGGTLQPSDGTPGSGPDFLAMTASTTIDSILDMDPFFLPFFSGGGEIIAVVGPFTEFFLDGATLYDPTLEIGDASVEFTALSQSGTYSVIYEYTVVPEPAAGLLIAGATLLAARRRRR